MHVRLRFAAVTSALALLWGCIPSTAHAADPSGMPRGLDLSRWVELLSWNPSGPSGASQLMDAWTRGSEAARPANSDRPSPDDPAAPKLKPPIHSAIVARDWSQSHVLRGHALATDDIRLTRSTRMLLWRVSFGDAAVAPFFHAGVGDWRYDLDLLPYAPRNREYAAQFATGVEVHLGPSASLAWEASLNVLLRESREPQNHANPYLTGNIVAYRLKF